MTTKVSGSVLANTGVTASSYGGITSSTNAIIPSIIVDAQGRITLASNNTSLTSNTISPQLISLGVGTAASGVLGEIRATNEVTAYYTSDINLKENIITIENALGKLQQLRGVMFDWKDEYIDAKGGEDGYFVRKHDTGVIAQEVENVVYQVHFSCETTKEGSEKKVIQHDAFTLDYANNTSYVPYSQLTEPQVLQWVFDILTPEGVIAVQTSGEQQLEEFINPTTATPSLPWV